MIAFRFLQAEVSNIVLHLLDLIFQQVYDSFVYLDFVTWNMYKKI